jgi:predicted NUDIX family phosphoesterase
VTATPGERVLVIPRERVPAPPWRGLRRDESAVAELLATVAAEARFESRADVERDPRFKQVIPYLILRDGPRWFLMRRTKAGGDARLHDRWSIGVGGHINPGDRDVLGGLRREWSEELIADFVPAFRAVGLLDDDETDVGSVHLGIVYVADAAGRPVAIRERDKLEGSFAEPAAVVAVRDAMESWSRLAFDALVDGPELAPDAAPARIADPGPDGRMPIIGGPGSPARTQG